MKLFLGSIGALVFLSVVFLVWSSVFGPRSTPAQPIAGVQHYTHPDRSHTTEKVTYSETPPTGGNHAPVWVACTGNAYDTPVPNEQAVHSLEHGAVWITYQPTIGNTAIAALKKRLRSYSFMSPFPDQKSPIVLTAWNNQLSLDSADDPRIDRFLKQFVLGAQTPEPGASCNAVSGGMQ